MSDTSEQTGNGGGIFNVNGTVTSVNSTVSGNRAEGDPGRGSGLGGGIANAAFDLRTSIALMYSTVAGNTAGRGGGIANAYLAQVAGAGPAEVVFRNSLVAGNQAQAGNPSCWNDIGSAGAGAVKLTSQGYNLEDRAACNFSQAADQPNTDPLLGPLGDNGGPTSTHALPFGSPAVDAIPAAACLVALDQRGVSRPQGSGCDIGAYEAQLPALRLLKTVATGGDPAQVRLGGIVTYTLVLSNAGAATAAGVALTDTLPAGVAFGDWLAQDSARLAPPDTITWGPADILADTSITISFTAAVTVSQAFAGQTITNTASFSTVDAGHGSSQATFGIKRLSLIYLPLLEK